ncbi:MAG: alpha/beta hydrolase [Flavobacteriaceae bacterium]
MTRILAFIIVHALGIALSSAQVKSEEILIKNDSIELPGTLTYTKDASKLIIWIHGSGNVDRNGNQAGINVGANYIKQFRDSINKQSIAFFSYDKRTATRKNMKFIMKNLSFDGFVSDAEKVISHFRKDERFKEIILVGHSQGSLVAMLASKNVDKYISLAGPSESIDVTLTKQVSKQSADLGKTTAAHFKELKETGDIKEVNPMLLSIFAKPNLPFFNSWMQYNPSDEIKKITIPTLIINGSKDIQVSVEEAKKLHAANTNAELKIIENMNHVIKHIEKDADNIPSYQSPNFPISKVLIEVITRFVKK